jgi:excisionase family DNA binding protein
MDLCGYQEAAKLLAVPIGTLYAWVHQKRVPHVRLGSKVVRFDRAELQVWIDAKRVGATGVSDAA